MIPAKPAVRFSDGSHQRASKARHPSEISLLMCWMNSISPYQPPSQGPPTLPPALAGDPPAVKVFGVLHLVLAGIGILGALWGLFIALVGNPFLKSLQSIPEMKAQYDIQIAMQEKIGPYSAITSALSLLIAIPMIIAGIKMLKKRRTGLKWSNIYAISSLGAKVAILIITITILVPAMQEMTRGIAGKGKTEETFTNIMNMTMTGSAIIGVVITCIYPVLSLAILNRPATKAWFASLGK